MNQRKGRKPMNQRKGGKQYVCGAGIVIISLIAFYAVLSGTENKRILLLSELPPFIWKYFLAESIKDRVFVIYAKF